MGLFSRKKPETEEAADPASSAKSSGEVEFSPEKARRFFEHAEAMHQASNYDYSLNLWLRGLRLDPINMDAMEGAQRAAIALHVNSGKGPSKDTIREFSGGRTSVDRYLSALLQYLARTNDTGLAVRAVEAASSLGLTDPMIWLADRALTAAGQDKKPRKDYFVKIMEAFTKAEKFDRAVIAGELACRLDPADSKLAAHVRNLSAESTMTRGGFDESGEEGGFRKNIRDAEKQRQLEDDARVVKSADALDRMINSLRAEWEAKPEDRPTIKKFAERLIERGRREDEDEAERVLIDAFNRTQEFRFREAVDRIRVKRIRRALFEARQAAAQNREDAAAAEAVQRLQKDLNSAEIESYEAQIKAYPTDLARKFELGRRLYEAGRGEEAIAFLQEAKNEPRYRAHALHYLAESFRSIGWNEESIETYRAAIVAHDREDDETSLDLRYGLMRALADRASESQDATEAEEAYKLASAIAMQQINFKDIREQRERLKSLVSTIRQGSGA